MNRASLFILVATVAACGAVSAPCDDGGTHGDAGAPTQCDAAGRTCDSAFGNFIMQAVLPAGCTTSGDLSRISVTFGLFDAGVGPVTVSSNTLQGTRMGCSTLVPSALLGSSGPVELTYDPGCQTLSGTLQNCCRYADAGAGSCALRATKP